MARFDQPKASRVRTVNLAGGDAFDMNPRIKLISNLVTSFVQDQYYRSAEEGMAEVRGLVNNDPLFAAKAAIYARDKFHMRSVTHVVASEVAKAVKGEKWSKRFFKRVVMRPDDALEILSLYLSLYGKPVPNSLKKGLGEALRQFDEYQLAKYKGERRGLSMVDLVNLCRPLPTQAIDKLMKGVLPVPETWETKLTQAGQEGKDKTEAWKELVYNKRIGYFALLRNIRNILETDDTELLSRAMDLLIDPKLIKNSKVLPFRYMTAFDALRGEPNSGQIYPHLEKALELSISNVPRLPGTTVVMLDESGSMGGRPFAIGSLFAAILIKVNMADLIMFSSRARYFNLNNMDSVMSLRSQMVDAFRSGGTNFIEPFELMEEKGAKYERIVILSDMQAWMAHSGARWAGGNLPTSVYEVYAKMCGFRPLLYSWDLQGYGSIQFPEPNIFMLAGFSEHVFSIMELLESDKEAMVKEVEAIEI